jgi:hypothetical protein
MVVFQNVDAISEQMRRIMVERNENKYIVESVLEMRHALLGFGGRLEEPTADDSQRFQQIEKSLGPFTWAQSRRRLSGNKDQQLCGANGSRLECTNQRYTEMRHETTRRICCHARAGGIQRNFGAQLVERNLGSFETTQGAAKTEKEV